MRDCPTVQEYVRTPLPLYLQGKNDIRDCVLYTSMYSFLLSDVIFFTLI